MSEIELTGKIEIGTSEEQAYARTNSRIDNIIAHNNDTEGNSELVDIRTGVDGTVYASAGTAVREQLEKVIYRQNHSFNTLTTTWQNGKSLNLENEVVQANRCISDYIDISSKLLEVNVPDDQSVKYSMVFFDANQQYVREIPYSTTSSTYDGRYDGSYCKYCRIRIGMNDDSVPSYYSDLTNAVVLKWADSSVQEYRGNIAALGYISFAQCTQNGYYAFSHDDLSVISDKGIITAGGILKVENNAASNQRFQTVVDANGVQYFRYGSNPFVKISDMSVCQQYRGNIQTLGYSTIRSCNQMGYYNCPTAYISNLTDKPSDLTSGFIVEVNPNAASEVVYQTITDNNGDQWFRYNDRPFEKRNSEGNTELVDIRTGVDGTVYASAGAAVREQLSEINDKQNAAFNSIPISSKYGKSLNLAAEVDQANRCISDYIEISGRNLEITVPDDGSVKYSFVFFDSEKQYIREIGYSNVSGVYSSHSVGNYSGVDYSKYCRMRIGMNDDSVPVVYPQLTNSVIVRWADQDVMKYRGNIIAEGYTSFSQCTKNGYYNFTQTDLSTISDAGGFNKGGILTVERNAAAGLVFQTILLTDGTRYFRYGSNNFIKYIDPTTLQYRGSIQSLEYTTIKSCTQSGYYNCPQSYLNNLTDKPADLSTGFIVEVLPNAAGGVTYQTITDNNGEQWFRYGENPFVRRNSDGYSKPVWYAIGDSITQGFYSYMNGDVPAISTTTNCWAKIAADKAELSLTNYGVGGSGFVHAATVGDRLNARDHVDTIDFSGADMVTIAFGINDWKGSDTFGTFDDDITTGGTVYSNMRYVIEKILTDNPECKIFIITPINASKYGNQSGNWSLTHVINGKTLEDMYQLEKTVAEYYGIELIDMTHNSVFNRINCPSLMVDGVHPTLKGHQLMGAEMAKKINFV